MSTHVEINEARDEVETKFVLVHLKFHETRELSLNYAMHKLSN
jgi:hypothetical protein